MATSRWRARCKFRKHASRSDHHRHVGDVGCRRGREIPAALRGVVLAGRTYPVDVEYLPKPAGRAPVWDLAVKELQRLVREESEGDVLIFMPGAYEISRTVQAAREKLGPQFVVFPLHGELPPRDQDAAVARYERRKVVVATNVAETSLTIDGVRLVVDSGLARIPRFDPYRGINTLLVEKISRAAADQRAGRAGRTAPGRCLRLWTAHEQEARPVQELPEVKRLDLAEVILTLKASGVVDVQTFRWLEAPDARALERAETLLTDLGAIDDTTGAITDLGRRMLAFPVHPRYARMLLAAQEYGCVRPVALIAALTQGRDLLLRRAAKQTDESRDDLVGDETSRIFSFLCAPGVTPSATAITPNAAGAWVFTRKRRARSGRCSSSSCASPEKRVWTSAKSRSIHEAVQRCVLLGFSDHLARRLDGEIVALRIGPWPARCAGARERGADAPLFVVSEVREVESSGGRERKLNVMLNLATAIKEEWLRELFPQDFKEATP